MDLAEVVAPPELDGIFTFRENKEGHDRLSF